MIQGRMGTYATSMPLTLNVGTPLAFDAMASSACHQRATIHAVVIRILQSHRPFTCAAN